MSDAPTYREFCAALHALRGTPQGRTVLTHLFQTFAPSRQRFTSPQGGGPIDPLAAAIRDGESNVTRYLESALALAEQHLAADRNAQPKEKDSQAVRAGGL